MNEFMQRPNRGNPRPASTNHESEETPQTHQSKKKGFDVSGMHIGMGVILVLGAFIAFATALLLMLGSNNAVRTENNLIDEDRYQAVFLNSQDGQVYFGRLSALNEDVYSMTDLFYVRVETDANQTSRVSLAQHINDLQGPDNVIFIKRDKVLFWENLREDGQVMCAIRDFQIKNPDTYKGNYTKDADCPEPASSTVDDSATQQLTPTGNQDADTQPAGTPETDDTAGAEAPAEAEEVTP